MFRPIQLREVPVTLVGAGEGSVELLNKALRIAPDIIAVDGGANLVSAAGQKAHAVIGDFDSWQGADLGGAEQRHMPDQNLTDFQKALASVEAPLFIGVGFLGGRLDHELAAFTALLMDPRPIVLLSEQELAFIAPRRLSLALPLESPLALYPLLATQLTTRGLRYPLENAQVAPDGLISTSNTVTGPVEIETDRQGVLVTAPLPALEPIVAGLRALAR